MTIARRYECLRCGQAVSLSADAFVSGRPAPACGKCRGTLKRVKGEPAQPGDDDHSPVRCGSPNFAGSRQSDDPGFAGSRHKDFVSDPYHQPSADSNAQPCPFEVKS